MALESFCSRLSRLVEWVGLTVIKTNLQVPGIRNALSFRRTTEERICDRDRWPSEGRIHHEGGSRAGGDRTEAAVSDAPGPDLRRGGADKARGPKLSRYRAGGPAPVRRLKYLTEHR